LATSVKKGSYGDKNLLLFMVKAFLEVVVSQFAFIKVIVIF